MCAHARACVHVCVFETTLWEASGPLCSHGVFAQVQSVRLQNSGAPSSLSGFKAEDWMKMIK